GIPDLVRAPRAPACAPCDEMIDLAHDVSPLPTGERGSCRLQACRQLPTLQVVAANMQDLNWNDIRVFLAVAEAGQIGRAARALRLDPTTLGRRLRRLERQLEITLFERTREGQTLTEAGEGLLAKAEAMAQAARSIDAVQSRQTGLGGNLRLSVSEGFGSQFLTLYLAEFARAHPNLSIELV